MQGRERLHSKLSLLIIFFRQRLPNRHARYCSIRVKIARVFLTGMCVFAHSKLVDPPVK